VLEARPLISDLVADASSAWEAVAWKVALDILLPLLGLWLLFKGIEWASGGAWGGPGWV
jgi:hypothetical protein